MGWVMCMALMYEDLYYSVNYDDDDKKNVLLLLDVENGSRVDMEAVVGWLMAQNEFCQFLSHMIWALKSKSGVVYVT